MLETGKIFGSVATKDFVVRSGALITGKVTMGMDDEPEETVETPAASEETDEPVEEPVAEPESEEFELNPDEE